MSQPFSGLLQRSPDVRSVRPQTFADLTLDELVEIAKGNRRTRRRLVSVTTGALPLPLPIIQSLTLTYRRSRNCFMEAHSRHATSATIAATTALGLVQKSHRSQ
jgi:hypothetical protein